MNNASSLYMKTSIELKDQLKSVMNECNLSEYDMARQLDVTVFTVKRFLKGDYVPCYVENKVKEWLE